MLVASQIINTSECRMWGEHGQAAHIFATKEKMRRQNLLSCSEVTIAVEVRGKVVVVHTGLAPVSWVQHRLSCQ